MFFMRAHVARAGERVNMSYLESVDTNAMSSRTP